MNRFLVGFSIVLALNHARAAMNTNVEPIKILELRDPLGEIPPSFWEQHGALVITGLILALPLIAFALWLLVRGKPAEAPLPAARATQALESLKDKPENGQLLSRVSQILKQYFSETYELPSWQLTTAEFCQVIQRDDKVELKLSSRVIGFLQECDRLKFSAGQPPQDAGAVSQALELVAASEGQLAVLKPAPQPGQPGTTPTS